MAFLIYCGLLIACSIKFCATQGISLYSQPINPTEYQQLIKQGFATNYFKTALPTARKYRTQNIQHVKDKGFRNLRLRCRPELYNDVYTTSEFQAFLTKLTEVVDECIDKEVAPIISWEHHMAEAYATEEDRLNYLDWWRRVAEALRDRNYLLSFNLFTELGIDICRRPDCRSIRDCCSESLRENKEKYHRWTSEVISTIRGTGGNNAQRILILGSPEKTSEGLKYIDPSASYIDSYMMVEWHSYAAGPTNYSDRPRYWSGNGNDAQKHLLRYFVELGNNFTIDTGIPTYFGAWMPRDNKDGGLNQTEVMSFAEFFVTLLKDARIPWSLNVLDNYYDTQRTTWKTGIQELATARLNMSLVLETILDAMHEEY